ncbi:MAG TPA: MFS transporter [Candidatus Binataceae bacterium]|jgi:MFS family permease|nr:MFS transporter [Candidatus Binataceae bacterium]
MTPQSRAWSVVGVLFTSLVLVAGSGYGTLGVFFVPLVKEFGWTHTRVSLLSSVLFGCMGWIGPLVGWLLDRVEAAFVMVAGTALAAVGFIVASQAHSYLPMLVAFGLLGFGIGAAAVLPTSFIVANWFDARRGLAMGITMAGSTTGAMLMTLVASYIISHAGWRTAYIVLAAPMLLVVIPAVAIVVRSRPPIPQTAASASTVPAASPPGLDLAQALRTRSFWMIAAAYFFYTFSTTAEFVHLIPYLNHLNGAGYRADVAAMVMSVIFGLASVGKPLFGVFADRLGGRIGLSINFLLASGGVVMMLWASKVAMLVLAVALLGINIEGPVVLLPLVAADSLGLSSFGVIMGVFTALSTLGATLGPLAAGRIFDATGDYKLAFEVLAAMLVCGAAAVSLCRPLAIEQARRAHAAFSLKGKHELAD